MKYQKVRTGDSVYEVAFDDKCIVVKQGEQKVWISKSMAKWIALNFAKNTEVEIVFV